MTREHKFNYEDGNIPLPKEFPVTLPTSVQMARIRADLRKLMFSLPEEYQEAYSALKNAEKALILAHQVIIVTDNITERK